MTRTSVLAGGAWLLGLCLMASSCTRTEQAAPASRSTPSDATGLAIEFRSEPDPPRSGDNTFEVNVTQPDGSPVIDATVTTVFSMPAMPSMNMPAMRSVATLTSQSAGRYRGTGQLSMGGTWNVLITVARGSEELGRKNLSVIAR